MRFLARLPVITFCGACNKKVHSYHFDATPINLIPRMRSVHEQLEVQIISREGDRKNSMAINIFHTLAAAKEEAIFSS